MNALQFAERLKNPRRVGSRQVQEAASVVFADRLAGPLRDSRMSRADFASVLAGRVDLAEHQAAQQRRSESLRKGRNTTVLTLEAVLGLKRGTRATVDIRESCDCQFESGATYNPDESKIENVLVLSQNSKNGRRYLPEAMREAVSRYQGAKVNIDHPSGNPNASRSVRDRLGVLQDTYIDPRGDVRATLIFNPHTEAGKALKWWAKNAPDAIGLSHNATGQGRSDPDGTFVVEKIVNVRSVDLVADPAATNGLFN